MTPQRSKEIGIIVFVVLYSAAIFSLTSLFIYQDRITMIPVIVVLVILAMLWAAFIAIVLAVIQHPGSVAWLTLGISLTLASAGLFRLPALVAAVLIAVFLFAARRAIYREANNRVLYRPGDIFTVGLHSILFGAGIAALGLTWPAVQNHFSPSSLLLSPQVVGKITEKVVPALSGPLGGFVDPNQVTTLVTSSVNQYIQSLISSYRSLFLIVILLAAILTWRALIPFVSWVVVLMVAALIYLARKANLIYLSRSQATIERLQL